VCNFEYEVEVLDEGAAENCRKLKFHAHVARDTFAVFLVIQLIIIILGFLMSAIDVGGAMKDVFPQWVSEHSKTSYYIWGFLLLLAALGIIGIIYTCIIGTPSRTECTYCYFANCDLHHCHGGDNDLGGCLILVVIIIVVLAFIGFFVGIFLASLLMQKIVQRHYRYLWLKS